MQNVPPSDTRRPPIGFYGDDFTGGTANLANFQKAGLNSIMFLDTPSPDLIEKHAAMVDVLGIAGTGRSLAPEAMIAEITPALDLFRSIGSPVVQYKICSTFDSSPEVGNLATVLSAARKLFGDSPVAVVPACPASGRYTIFSNHFARYKSQVYRLDRHPVMAVHPSTPMSEADLRKHLERQGDVKVGAIDLDILRAGENAIEAEFHAASIRREDAVIFDGCSESDLDVAAQFIWKKAQEQTVFTIAAQDLALSLGRHVARLSPPPRPASTSNIAPVDRMLVLSGSASALNGEQIRYALDRGWAGISLDATSLLTDGPAAIHDVIQKQVSEHLCNGRSAIVYTALGPDDPTLAWTRQALKENNVAATLLVDRIGALYGAIADRAIREHALPRLVLAGGDTSSQTMRRLDAYALRIAAGHPSGGNISRIYSSNPMIDGTQVLLKGGQVGAVDIFLQTLEGSGWVLQHEGYAA